MSSANRCSWGVPPESMIVGSHTVTYQNSRLFLTTLCVEDGFSVLKSLMLPLSDRPKYVEIGWFPFSAAISRRRGSASLSKRIENIILYASIWMYNVMLSQLLLNTRDILVVLYYIASFGDISTKDLFHPSIKDKGAILDLVGFGIWSRFDSPPRISDL